MIFWVKFGKLNLGDIMNIIKYKKKTNGRYSVTLEDGREFVLYEDIILKHDLLLRKEILEKDLDSLLQDNLECDVYYVALNLLRTRFRSKYELEELLKRKEYPIPMILKATEKLTNQGYLNDQLFAKSYISSQMITTNHGPNRIKNDLENKHISNAIIQEELDAFSEEEQRNKINKIIDYRIKTNRSRGGTILKNKIYHDLLQLGYDSSLVNSCLNDYSFSNNQELAKKEYDKLYRKYSRKYQGTELERVIKDKLYQKGLVYEEES